MENFVRHGYKGPFLASLNRCRMYLQIVWLSDISDMEGKCIDKLAMQGCKSDYITTPHTWPIQMKPATKDWSKWRKALQQSLGLSRSSRRLPLGKHLGKWHHYVSPSHWKWRCSPNSATIYQYESGTIARQYKLSD